MSPIDGRAIAKAITAEVSEGVAALRARDVVPTLAVLVPTRDEATAWYVRSIQRAAGKVGVDCRVVQLDDPAERDITRALDELSADASVHGVICQTPLPEGVRLDEVAGHIAPAKDVDGANPLSLGRLAAGLPSYAPATAAAVLEILHREAVPLAGARAVVVGRSTVVGKPAALLLVNEHATVTVCHSRTKDLAAATAEADVLVVAVGRAGFIGAEHVRPGAVVIDVGTNPTADGGLAGDVQYDAVAAVAGSITPVPGGVGPVTTALLLRHTVAAAEG
ncbi:bifunctional 5,10-methylenetetrahydrofolate dehydrogenase/5,10-methenyltetrahydrofolate cyclohydrolase [Amycolatopsis sp. cmx-4-83]|uniref:bifunctional 5,10-methylenetetrahydrofolate dehydrogenase/5,10-methenyltetrahydrofolate cyclohydrolase n=1 Tax=Amycolatopsis sp. cmx-4-83 TaxID=2790940 RepID=UPI00397CD342